MQRSVSTTTHFLGLTINKNPYKKRQEQKKLPNIYKRRKKMNLELTRKRLEN
jgi:hypothetical protein